MNTELDKCDNKDNLLSDENVSMSASTCHNTEDMQSETNF